MQGIKRELFPILKKILYFNTCSVGALATPVRLANEIFLDQWNDRGGFSWEGEDGWVAIVEKARAIFALLINAAPENIAVSFGNSVAFSSITSCYNFQNQDEVVFNELDFPATATQLMARTNQYRVATSNDGKTISVEDYKNVISNRTKLVSTCHIVSNTGFKIDINALIDFSHSKDIPVFIDAYQSIGTIPVDVKELDVDFLATGCLKWLLGGFGMSFLYIRDDLIDKLNPSSIGWMGVENPFEDLYNKLRTTLHRPRDATKFQYGTAYPNGATSAYAGMKIIRDIGITVIHKQNMLLTQELIQGAEDLDLTCLTPSEPEHRGSIVNIQVTDVKPVVVKLKEQNFVLDMRAHGIRISPHFYNSSEDIEQLLSCLKQLL